MCLCVQPLLETTCWRHTRSCIILHDLRGMVALTLSSMMHIQVYICHLLGFQRRR